MMRSDEVRIGFGPSIDIYENSGKARSRNYPTADKITEIQKNPRKLFWGNVIGAPSATIFRNDPNLKFDERFKWLVDIEFYIRMISSPASLAYNVNAVTNIGISEKQVSESCFGNPAVELPENILLYSYLPKKQSYYLKDLLHMFRIIDRCNISSRSTLLKFSSIPLRFSPVFAGVYLKNLAFGGISRRASKMRLNDKEDSACAADK